MKKKMLHKAEVIAIEDKLLFGNRQNVYCYECKTQMSFNGNGYDCPICGFSYSQKALM